MHARNANLGKSDKFVSDSKYRAGEFAVESAAQQAKFAHLTAYGVSMARAQQTAQRAAALDQAYGQLQSGIVGVWSGIEECSALTQMQDELKALESTTASSSSNTTLSVTSTAASSSSAPKTRHIKDNYIDDHELQKIRKDIAELEQRKGQLDVVDTSRESYDVWEANEKNNLIMHAEPSACLRLLANIPCYEQWQRKIDLEQDKIRTSLDAQIAAQNEKYVVSLNDAKQAYFDYDSAYKREYRICLTLMRADLVPNYMQTHFSDKNAFYSERLKHKMKTIVEATPTPYTASILELIDGEKISDANWKNLANFYPSANRLPDFFPAESQEAIDGAILSLNEQFKINHNIKIKAGLVVAKLYAKKLHLFATLVLEGLDLAAQGINLDAKRVVHYTEALNRTVRIYQELLPRQVGMDVQVLQDKHDTIREILTLLHEQDGMATVVKDRIAVILNTNHRLCDDQIRLIQKYQQENPSTSTYKIGR